MDYEILSLVLGGIALIIACLKVIYIHTYFTNFLALAWVNKSKNIFPSVFLLY